MPKVGQSTALKLLRMTIKTSFTEFLQSRGFEKFDEDRLTYRFRRQADGRQDLVEVQFDKHRRPKFVVNAGRHPAEGIVDAYGRFVNADKVHVSQLVDQAGLYALPKTIFWEPWFGIGRLSIRTVESAARREIERLTRLFDQVERWLTAGSRGPSIYVRTVRQNKPGFAKATLTAKGLWPPDGWTEGDEAALRK
jgi:hypothetical protein